MAITYFKPSKPFEKVVAIEFDEESATIKACFLMDLFKHRAYDVRKNKFGQWEVFYYTKSSLL